MGIRVEDSTIIVTDGTYTFKDICDGVGDADAKEVAPGVYHLKRSLFVGEKDCTGEAELIDAGCTVIIDGEYVQVHKGSKLVAGEKRANGTTMNGCTFVAKGLTTYYGFGGGADTDGNGRDPNIAGDLFLYGCNVDMWTFWAWFRGTDQVVEIVNCIVNGYGRVQGGTSIVDNVIMEKSNGRYGVLSPKGELAVYRGISVGATDGTSEEAAIYWNPKLAPYMRITGGSFSGYKKLMYVEATGSAGGTLEFIGTEIKGTFDRFTKDDGTNWYLKYVYNPVLRDMDGNVLGNQKVKLLGEDEAVIEELTSDNHGMVYAELVAKQQIGDGAIEEFSVYGLKGTIGSGDSAVDFKFWFGVNGDVKGTTITLGGGSGGGTAEIDYDRIQAMVDNGVNGLAKTVEVEAVGTKVDEIETDVYDDAVLMSKVDELAKKTDVDSIGTKVDEIGEEVLDTDVGLVALKRLSDKIVVDVTNSKNAANARFNTVDNKLNETRDAVVVMSENDSFEVYL